MAETGGRNLPKVSQVGFVARPHILLSKLCGLLHSRHVCSVTATELGRDGTPDHLRSSQSPPVRQLMCINCVAGCFQKHARAVSREPVCPLRLPGMPCSWNIPVPGKAELRGLFLPCPHWSTERGQKSHGPFSLNHCPVGSLPKSSMCLEPREALEELGGISERAGVLGS